MGAFRFFWTQRTSLFALILIFSALAHSLPATNSLPTENSAPALTSSSAPLSKTALPLKNVPDSAPIKTSRFGLEDLRRWHQWGLYDSVLVHWEGVSATLNPDFATQEAAEVLLLRSAARFSKGDTAEALLGFRQAACLDSMAVLDSFYVSAPLWHRQAEIRRAALLDECAPLDDRNPLNASIAQIDSGDHRDRGGNDRATSTQNKPQLLSNPPVHQNSWKKPAGWAALGLGSGAGALTAFALTRESQAFSDMRSAGKRGDDEAYRNFKIDRDEWRTVALAGAVLTAAGLGCGLYWLWNREASVNASRSGFQFTPDGQLAFRF
jgi:hypothetical protein